jgi:hypothetical protein
MWAMVHFVVQTLFLHYNGHVSISRKDETAPLSLPLTSHLYLIAYPIVIRCHPMPSSGPLFPSLVLTRTSVLHSWYIIRTTASLSFLCNSCSALLWLGKAGLYVYMVVSQPTLLGLVIPPPNFHQIHHLDSVQDPCFCWSIWVAVDLNVSTLLIQHNKHVSISNIDETSPQAVLLINDMYHCISYSAMPQWNKFFFKFVFGDQRGGKSWPSTRLDHQSNPWNATVSIVLLLSKWF